MVLADRIQDQDVASPSPLDRRFVARPVVGLGIEMMSLPILKRHPVADARRHECSAGSQYPTAGRPPSHGVTLTTLTPCSMLFRTTHRPQTSWVSPPDAVASPRRRHRPSPEVPRFVTLTRTQLAASRAAGQAVCPSTVISKAGPQPCGVGPDCGLVPQAASAIAAIMQIRDRWGKERKLCSLHRYIRMAGDAGVPVSHWSWLAETTGAQSQRTPSTEEFAAHIRQLASEDAI